MWVYSLLSGCFRLTTGVRWSPAKARYLCPNVSKRVVVYPKTRPGEGPMASIDKRNGNYRSLYRTGRRR